MHTGFYSGLGQKKYRFRNVYDFLVVINSKLMYILREGTD